MNDNDRLYCLMSGKALLVCDFGVPVFTTEEQARRFDRLGAPIVSTPAHLRTLTRLEVVIDPLPGTSPAAYRTF